MKYQFTEWRQELDRAIVVSGNPVDYRVSGQTLGIGRIRAHFK